MGAAVCGVPSVSMALTAALGIDIGGSGMKAAPVELATGELLAERHQDLHAAACDP